ncbi:MAG: transposase [Alphaproteobacteria bacterium]|nr:transposase [Alphaproteobacteria bacterium]MDE2492950.1 transposase [Alphaproteobacteria bacterium]
MNEQHRQRSALVHGRKQALHESGRRFVDHQTVTHSKNEYARGEVHTNTVEGFFSIFKRGMIGVYQHCDEKHLHRYLTEFDYRYNHREGLGFSDWERTEATFPGIVGERLTYRRTHQVHV